MFSYEGDQFGKIRPLHWTGIRRFYGSAHNQESWNHLKNLEKVNVVEEVGGGGESYELALELDVRWWHLVDHFVVRVVVLLDFFDLLSVLTVLEILFYFWFEMSGLDWCMLKNLCRIGNSVLYEFNKNL